VRADDRSPPTRLDYEDNNQLVRLCPLQSVSFRCSLLLFIIFRLLVANCSIGFICWTFPEKRKFALRTNAIFGLNLYLSTLHERACALAGSAGMQSKPEGGWKPSVFAQNVRHSSVTTEKTTCSSAHTERVTVKSRCRKSMLFSVRGSRPAEAGSLVSPPSQAGNCRRSCSG
jgi:hypothetical protein